MSVKNQSKNKKKYEFEKQSVPTKDVVDVASQTNSSKKEDGSCQTDSPGRQDFQVQTNGPKQAEPIATQTENSPKCDFQSQANIQREGSSVAVQTIKEEVAMPNIPNSAAPIQAKKRKLSSTLSAGSPIQPSQSISNGAGDQLNNMQVAVDEAILSSEIYKIYCRNEDPNEAIKKIKELKTCLSFEQATLPALAEEDLRRQSTKTLNQLWALEPERGYSKFIKIKSYWRGCIHGYTLDSLNQKMHHAFKQRFTKIKMLLPNGYEFWYVSNIKKGLGSSKWYRAESTCRNGVRLLAELNVMGITTTTIENLQYKHHLKGKILFETEKTPWFRFAIDVVFWHFKSLFPSSCSDLRYGFDVEETKSDNANVVKTTFRLYHGDRNSRDQKIFKTYLGKSTRPFKKGPMPKKQKEEMEKEAKKAALMEFFKERFGFTEFNDLNVDEFHRSIGN